MFNPVDIHVGYGVHFVRFNHDASRTEIHSICLTPLSTIHGRRCAHDDEFDYFRCGKRKNYDFEKIFNDKYMYEFRISNLRQIFFKGQVWGDTQSPKLQPKFVNSLF